MTLLALALAALGAAASDRTVTDGGDIAAALATVINEGGGTVWLEEGTYSLASQTALVDIPDGVSIQAKGARENTIIDLANGYGWALKGATAKIKGVTFTSSVTFTDSADFTLPRIVNVVTGTLENCVFRDFTVGGTKYCGSHPVQLSENGVITGCLFTNLTGTVQYISARSGTISANGGLITNSFFRACNLYHAPIYAYNPTKTVVVTHCEFTGQSGSSGATDAQVGAVYSYSIRSMATAVRLSHCLIANNQCTVAGAFYGYCGNSGGDVTLEDCVVTNNTGRSSGGVYGVGNKQGVGFDRCILVHNKGAKTGVGGITGWRSASFRNCLIADNVGTSTAGVLLSDSAIETYVFENCTITGNRTVNGAVHGVSVANTGNGNYIYNCIVYGNGNNASDQQLTAPAAKVFTSCYPEATDGNANGNISANPLFKNAAGEDYRLNYASPCLDVATDRAATCGTLDLVGTERPQSAKGVSEAWDMGCYEMPPNTEPMAVVVTIGATSGTSPASVTATATATGSGLSGLVYDWTVTRTTPSGATQTEYKGLTTNELTVADLGPGSYSFKVKVTNSKSETAEDTCSDTLSVRSAVCYVKSKAVGVWPYDSWDKATSNLVTAIENANEKVVVAAGVYDVTNEFGRMTDGSDNDCAAFLNRALAVEGAGREATVLKLADRTGFVLNHADACVRSLTVTGGKRTDVEWNGAAFRILSGCVSNVVVRDGGTFGSTVYVGVDARFTDAVVTNMTHCNATYHPILTAGGILEDVLVTDCLGQNCGGISLAAPAVSARTRLTRVTVTKCGARWSRTSALSADYPCTATDCDFSYNNTGRATGGGTVVSVNGGSPRNPDMIMSNCRVVGNAVGGSVAVTSGSWGSFIATNLLVAGNRCGYALDIVEWSPNSKLVNCTVTDNTSTTMTNAGVRIAISSGADQAYYGKTLKNCVFWGNHGLGDAGGHDCEITTHPTYAHTIWNCCWPEADAATFPTVNCTAADPKLRTGAFRTYYPRMTGSCFNAGTNEAWMATATDLDGNDRLRYGRVDIGCFEAEHDPGLMLLVK